MFFVRFAFIPYGSTLCIMYLRIACFSKTNKIDSIYFSFLKFKIISIYLINNYPYFLSLYCFNFIRLKNTNTLLLTYSLLFVEIIEKHKFVNLTLLNKPYL